MYENYTRIHAVAWYENTSLNLRRLAWSITAIAAALILSRKPPPWRLGPVRSDVRGASGHRSIRSRIH